MTDFNFRVINSTVIPPGTMLLLPNGDPFGLNVEPIIFQQDPWPTKHLPEPAATERYKALDFLADLLDNECRHWGMDPDHAWRNPKIAEREHREHTLRMRYVAEERLTLNINRPGSPKITFI